MNRRQQTVFQAMFVLAALGFAVALELVEVHVQANTDSMADSFCNLSAAVSCDVVARSSWSVFLGLPVAVWGVFFYSFMLAAMAWAATSGKLAGLLIAVTTFSEVFSLTLAAVSLFVIESLCVLCAASWVINLFLNVLAFRLAPASKLPDLLVEDARFLWTRKKTSSALAATALAVLCLLWAFYPRYWA